MKKGNREILIYILVIIAFVLIINFAINYDYNKTKEQIETDSEIFENNNSLNINDDNKEIIKEDNNGEINMTNNNDENHPIVQIQTNKGNITLRLDKEKAPITVNNFLKYVNNEFYNNTIFHRVIKDFMIQGGGFISDGTQKETLEPIVLESNNGLKNNKGTIAMARTMDPNSATSQFFINTVDNDFLNYNSQSDGYAVFGEVISGLEVVLDIENSETKSNGQHQDWPVEDIIINKVIIIN